METVDTFTSCNLSPASAFALLVLVALSFVAFDSRGPASSARRSGSLPPPLPPREGYVLNQPLPLVQKAALHWARNGHWVAAASAADDSPLFPPGAEFITLPPEYRDFPAFTKSCGDDETRAIPLSQRWRFFDLPLAPPGVPAYPTWSRSDTCAALHGRAVIIVGDSLSGEFTDTLVTALQSEGTPPPSMLRAFRANVCGGSVPVFSIAAPRWSSDDFFAHWEEPTFHTPDAQNRQFFQETISEAAAAADRSTNNSGGAGTLWVLNRGAHYAELGEHLARVAATLDFVRYLAPFSAVFWRTSGPAHPDHLIDPSVQNSAPLEDALGAERYDVY